MSFAIPSIQHTGTKFVARMFKEYQWKSLNEEWHEPSIFVGHISNGMLPHVKSKLEQYQAVIPLRHPFLVAESWKRRGKPLPELVNNFRLLVNEVDKFEPCYLAIDSDDREEQLKFINLRLNLDLKTDWSVVNSVSGTYDLNRLYVKPEKIILELVDEIGDFLNQFY